MFKVCYFPSWQLSVASLYRVYRLLMTILQLLLRRFCNLKYSSQLRSVSVLLRLKIKMKKKEKR